MSKFALNGRAPTAAELHRIAVGNYGHFTSMQVRDGKVRGMALHLARLDDGNETFFGRRGDVDDELQLREWIRQALGGTADASVRVTVVAEGVLVSVGPPVPDTPMPPLRVRTDPYQRPWPAHQHVATMGTGYARRSASAAGYDDALFVGPDGLVREGSIWNVAFWDGTAVVFPEAPVLKGVTMVLLQVAMTMAGIPWRLGPVPAAGLPDLLAAAAVNSHCPAQPIASIDDVVFDAAGAALVSVLRTAWETVPWDDI